MSDGVRMIRRVSSAPMVREFSSRVDGAKRDLVEVRAAFAAKSEARHREAQGYKLSLRDRVAMARSVSERSAEAAERALADAENGLSRVLAEQEAFE